MDMTVFEDRSNGYGKLIARFIPSAIVTAIQPLTNLLFLVRFNLHDSQATATRTGNAVLPTEILKRLPCLVFPGFAVGKSLQCQIHCVFHGVPSSD